jgi:chromosomal replication initiation ATPase DnaA
MSYKTIKIINMNYFIIPGITTPNKTMNDKADDIINAVCFVNNFNPEFIITNMRNAYIITVKRMACYYLNQLTTLTLEQVAIKVGLTNHATAHYHIKKYKGYLLYDKPTREKDLDFKMLMDRSRDLQDYRIEETVSNNQLN